MVCVDRGGSRTVKGGGRSCPLLPGQLAPRMAPDIAHSQLSFTHCLAKSASRALQRNGKKSADEPPPSVPCEGNRVNRPSRFWLPRWACLRWFCGLSGAGPVSPVMVGWDPGGGPADDAVLDADASWAGRLLLAWCACLRWLYRLSSIVSGAGDEAILDTGVPWSARLPPAKALVWFELAGGVRCFFACSICGSALTDCSARSSTTRKAPIATARIEAKARNVTTTIPVR